ncbi:VOC family protein [Novosphingobium pentaromativorans]|uniref:Glyoxalase/bleomycin resistance protein/dioxygenase n=1 Tax=Novosphingobium pentaromativorans US6-1 TaxID=1088721 RepID=G6EGE7_9SPHN|nr:VOC family protein [Novosphingobium pentaromativorans]EHJ59598.1 Glyoxalase/bleomycin resistance protein/dioxygenase [Novosphingobium pentaromativorans US6-1]
MLNGIARLNFGVEDLEKAARFLDDFGLPGVERTADHALYRLAEGSYISVRHIEDPLLPKSDQVGCGVREVIWGVDDADSLRRYVSDLRRDHDVTEDEEGTFHFVTSFGQAMGLRLWQKIPVVSSPSPLNAPGSTQRFNQWRKWRHRAEPKQIMHAVFAYPDVNAALDFYRDRLDFRVSEVQMGIGIYLRCPGSSMHHTTALLDANVPFVGDGRLKYDHTNFIVEDIDEIMVGKAYMERQGWEKSQQGLGRHRIGSALFLYMPSPTGGDIEYGADVDAIDDTWIPHQWSADFGYRSWIHSPPPFMLHEPEHKLGFVDGATVRHRTIEELIEAGEMDPPEPAAQESRLNAGEDTSAPAQ